MLRTSRVGVLLSACVGLGGLVSLAHPASAPVTRAAGLAALLAGLVGAWTARHTLRTADSVERADAERHPDRVAVTGVTGEAPPERLKVCINELGGFRNQMEFVLTGLDIDAKAAWVQAQLGPALTAASVTWTRTDTGRPGADTEEAASCLLRCSVTDPSPDPVGKAFTGPAIELALGSYPGFTMTSPPAPATPYGVYRPAYVDRSVVRPTVVMPDGGRRSITDSGPSGAAASSAPPVASPTPAAAGATTAASLGTFLHARSGDKGGDANLGLWVTHDDPARWDARVAWLLGWVTAERVRALVPEAADLDIDVVALPNLGGVNVVLHGLLGLGVAASSRFDPQAKGLGEWVRSRVVDIPEELV